MSHLSHLLRGHPCCAAAHLKTQIRAITGAMRREEDGSAGMIYLALLSDVYDVADSAAAAKRSAYMARYGIEPGWSFAMNYDAAMIVVEAMRRAQVTGAADTRAAEREAIRAAFNRSAT